MRLLFIRRAPLGILFALCLAIAASPCGAQSPPGPTPLVASIVTKGNPVSPKGTRATVDIPRSRHIRNVGSNVDRAGLCVPSSIEVASDWQNVRPTQGFRAYTETRPGGSYPEKLAADLSRYCGMKGVPVPAYVQHTGGELNFLKSVLKTGRMVGVTYGGADNFYGGPIAHMVDLVHLDDDEACIVDNNRPGNFVWMSARQFENRWLGLYDDGRPMREKGFLIGGGWAFVWLAPPPPPHAEKPADEWDVPTGPDGRPVLNFGVEFQQLPANQPQAAPAETNFGIDVSKIRGVKSYSLNGTDVSKEVAKAAINDDSGNLSISYVGVDPVPVLPESVRLKAHVQSYAASDWEVGYFKLDKGASVRAAAVNRIGKTLGVVEAAKVTAESVTALVLGSAPEPKPDSAPSPVPSPTGPYKLKLAPGDVVPPGVRIEIDLPASSPAKVEAVKVAGPARCEGCNGDCKACDKCDCPPTPPQAMPSTPKPEGDGWAFVGGFWQRPSTPEDLRQFAPVAAPVAPPVTFPAVNSCPKGRCGMPTAFPAFPFAPASGGCPNGQCGRR